jgi:hypothetical protein
MGALSARARRVWPALAVLAVVAACGSSEAPQLDTSGFTPIGAGRDAGTSTDGGTTVLQTPDAGAPTCDSGNVCGCLDLDLVSDPPNLYFMLDRSGSMNNDSKWSTVRTVVAQVITGLGPRARFGAAVFPDKIQDGCVAGGQVMQLSLGDAPAGAPGPTVEYFTASTDLPAIGGTPTALTLTNLTSLLTGFTGKTFVILATDGGPNCNAALSCDASSCCSNIEGDPGCDLDGGPNCCAAANAQTNCLDTTASVKAIEALAAQNVLTYVIGLPESAPYEGVLNQMAQAGGTARPNPPYYYAVDTADQAALAATLSSIAAKLTATCTFTLSQAPPDPGMVNLYLDGKVIPQDPTNGWTLSGQTVTLVGTACTAILDGDVLSLRVVAGCPTVLQ